MMVHDGYVLYLIYLLLISYYLIYFFTRINLFFAKKGYYLLHVF